MGVHHYCIACAHEIKDSNYRKRPPLTHTPANAHALPISDNVVYDRIHDKCVLKQRKTKAAQQVTTCLTLSHANNTPNTLLCMYTLSQHNTVSRRIAEAC